MISFVVFLRCLGTFFDIFWDLFEICWDCLIIVDNCWDLFGICLGISALQFYRDRTIQFYSSTGTEHTITSL